MWSISQSACRSWFESEVISSSSPVDQAKWGEDVDRQLKENIKLTITDKVILSVALKWQFSVGFSLGRVRLRAWGWSEEDIASTLTLLGLSNIRRNVEVKSSNETGIRSVLRICEIEYSYYSRKRPIHSIRDLCSSWQRPVRAFCPIQFRLSSHWRDSLEFIEGIVGNFKYLTEPRYWFLTSGQQHGLKKIMICVRVLNRIQIRMYKVVLKNTLERVLHRRINWNDSKSWDRIILESNLPKKPVLLA